MMNGGQEGIFPGRKVLQLGDRSRVAMLLRQCTVKDSLVDCCFYQYTLHDVVS